MTQKQMAWKVKGMNQDLSVSAFNPEFAFENHNLRLSTNENNTTLSWVNEKGTSELEMNIDLIPWEEDEDNKIFSAILSGTPIGIAVIDNKLVVFTTGNKDRIYVLQYNADQSAVVGSCLYCGNLGFDAEYPLETLVSYESSAIEKVYWTDGVNQPRVINIAADNDKIKKWNHNGNSTSAKDTFFDFVPCVQLNETVSIDKISGGGTFVPGTIQYCFTYINKYQQQSNVVYQSPLYYLTHSDRCASPEDKVSSSFSISIDNLDTSFDYVRLYSIQRTSVNDTPFVKLISDIPVGSGSITYLDNGTTGSAMDPTELLYVGGKEITALTMAAKDQTLFLGNLVEKNSNVDELQDWLDGLREGSEENKIGISFNCDNLKSYDIEKPAGTYGKSFTLNRNQRQITTFKGGENYRFGFQLQKKTGEWSQPVFIDDAVNTTYPSATDENVRLVYAQATLKFPNGLFNSVMQDYRRIRPVVVFPNMNDRRVLCQGVLNPTVFNIYNRAKNQPFAQASWYFRPMCNPMMSGIDDIPSAEDNPHVIVDSSKYRVYTDYVNAEYLKGIGLAGSYYVLVGNLQGNKDQIDAVLGEKLHYKADENDTTVTNEDYLYYIYLGKGKARDGSTLQNQYTYAFVRKEDADSSTDLSWPGTESQKGYIAGYYSIGSTGSTLDFVSGSVYVCKFEGINKFGTPGYISSDNVREEAQYNAHGGLLSVVLQFCHKAPLINSSATNWSESDGWKYYSVTFINQALIDDSGESDVTVNSDGSNVIFQHYSSLPSSIDGMKNVEIQGAINRYITPYDSAEDKPLEEARSNNQFFVDQSIVTLNSPDIEFDTAVQTWGTEDLRLRIVGVVPIHASISSHSITTKSNMLSLDSGAATEIRYGVGEKSYNVVHNYKDILAGRRLVADYLWNDAYISSYLPGTSGGEDTIDRLEEAADYLVYPWHKTGSLINDPRSIAEAASVLETKKEANFLFSGSTDYLSSFKEYNIHAAIHLTENSFVHNIRLSKQLDTLESELNYYPNVDYVLYNESKYPMYAKGLVTTSVNDPVAMKYLSTSHAVIALVPESDAAIEDADKVPILPSASSVPATVYSNDGTGEENRTLWNDIISFSQDSIETSSLDYHFLWLGELYKEPSNPFGGKTREAVRANTWIIGGDEKDLNPSDFNPNITLTWTEGDTYYQRYDCLKTYPMSPMDTNQLVEILSFMCETRTNIDGRYDKNRGQKDNTEMTPQNFNLLNPAYTQQNNFFNYRQLDNEANSNLEYPNQIYFTKTKTSGADVDLWTNINLGSTLELEGDKGAISKIVKFNDTLLAFQERGISQILYNENVQIATQQGVPIEIANSGKVQGARYISDNVGCSNKWSVVNTASGVYFIDSSNKAIYLFNGQLNNITLTKGMNTWAKRNISTIDDVWYPGTESNAFVSYYDKQNNDVLFINKDKALAFSEKMDAFTSFYDYGDTPYFVNFRDTGVWIRNNGTLWKHQGGNYCKFFDAQKPYWMQLVGNAEPNLDKIFTNLEFRATVDGDGTFDEDNRFVSPLLPFDRIEVWNEYQHGITSLENWNKSNYGMWHYIMDDASALNRKFRIWRCDIPRDTAPTTSDVGMNISRKAPHPLNRIRNPWIYLKLYKDKDTSSRTEIHDMVMTYYL